MSTEYLDEDEPDLDDPIPPPPGCVSAEAHEAKLTVLADELEALARKALADGKTGMSTVEKLLAAAIKARRACLALTLTRTESERNKRLIRAGERMGLGK